MFLVAPLFITACFGVEPSSIQNPVLILPPAAVSENLNTIIVINDQNTHTVSLKGLVTVEEGLELALDSVDPLSANCLPPSSLDAKNMTYTFSPPSGPKVCFYRYTLSTKGSDGGKTQSHALNYVRIISDITDSKPPLSFPHFNVKHIENSPFEINVVAELTKLNISTTGKILASDVIVLGSGSAIAMNENSILFTPSTPHPCRVFFTP